MWVSRNEISQRMQLPWTESGKDVEGAGFEGIDKELCFRHQGIFLMDSCNTPQFVMAWVLRWQELRWLRTAQKEGSFIESNPWVSCRVPIMLGTSSAHPCLCLLSSWMPDGYACEAGPMGWSRRDTSFLCTKHFVIMMVLCGDQGGRKPCWVKPLGFHWTQTISTKTTLKDRSKLHSLCFLLHLLSF
jgi:hypothetical protein